MKFNALFVATSAAVLLIAAGSARAAVVETTHFIGSPTSFNGFEGIGSHPGDFLGPYTEDGITVQHIGDDGIWTDSDARVGNYSWYKNGGGTGYTRITLASLADFSAIQFLAFSGFIDGGGSLNYQLVNNGSVVQTGVAGPVPAYHGGSRYYGFSGGGFDEVRVQVTLYGAFSGGDFEAGIFDSIAVGEPGGVPEPATWGLLILGFGLSGVMLRSRRRMATAAI